MRHNFLGGHTSTRWKGNRHEFSRLRAAASECGLAPRGNGTNGNHLVGQPAVNAAFKNPSAYFTHFKRGIATQPDQPWNGGPTPVELGGIVLGYIWEVILKTNPEVRDYIPELGGSRDPEQLQIIITHPATYSIDAQKALEKAVGLVGQGFRINGLIAEPVAGSLIFREQQGQHLKQGDLMAVIDLGGGTEDICVERFDHGLFEPVVAAKGDPKLGGLNFTGRPFLYWAQKLGHRFEKCFHADRGLDLAGDPSLSEAERRVATSLWNKAEEAKIQLSTVDSVTLFLETPEGLEELQLTRDEFLQLCAEPPNLWDQFDRAVADTIDGSTFTWADIQHVILIGGSALLPGLRERVAAVTNRKPEDVFLSSDATHVVANGAAYQAFVHEATGHCLPGGLAVRLRESLRVNPNAPNMFKFFFRTGEIVPASGTTVEELGQFLETPGGLFSFAFDLVEAKPGVQAQVGALLQEGEIVPLCSFRPRVCLPAGHHELQIGFDVDPNGKLHYRLRFPKHPELEVVTGTVNDGDIPADGPRPGQDVALVFDCSSSMDGSKLRSEKDATHTLLGQASLADVRVCLIEFGGTTRLACRLGTPLQHVGEWVERMKADGGTPMAEGLQIAWDHLQHESPDGRERLLILTTDGQPNDAEPTKRAAALVKQHARIVCIGIGRDVSETLLMELASTPNDYFHADSASAIGGIFHTIGDLYFKKD